jgi:Acetyltransferases
MNVREFTIDRYDEVVSLWRRTPGICVRDTDSREATERYLRRNPGLSFIAEVDGIVVGSALSGHDGRRGYLQHVAVEPQQRKRGIADTLVSHCLAALQREGILKVHLDVLTSNVDAQDYWLRRGWEWRDDLIRFSRPVTLATDVRSGAAAKKR